MKLKQTIQLYELMYQRFLKNPFTTNQAQMIKETITLMQSCSTVEEATSKIRQSYLYNQGAKALMLDRLNACIQASEVQKREDVKAVYEKKQALLFKDDKELQDTSYLQQVNALNQTYETRYDQFSKLYELYMESEMLSYLDMSRLEEIKREVKQVLNWFVSQNLIFKEIAQTEEYRCLCSAQENAYLCFTKQIEAMEISFDEAQEHIEQEFQVTWNAIQQEKAQIIEIGRKNNEYIRYANAIIVPPDSKDGQYRFVMEVVQDE